jgi:hypothetical protein
MVAIRQFNESTAILAGISWDIADKSMGRMEARSKAKGADANAVLLRGEDRNLGMAQLPGKMSAWHGQRVVAFAGALADAAEAETWCGVFEFERKFVYVAAVDRRILADGDTLYPNAAAARSRLDSERELFETIYAPAEWAFASAIEAERPDDAGRWIVLEAESLSRSVDWNAAATMQMLGEKSKLSPKMVLICTVGVVALAGIGFQYWSARKAEQERIERERQNPPPPPIPWLDKPKAIAAFHACQSVRGDMTDLGHYGWKIEKLECDIASQKFTASLVPFLTGPLPPATRPGQTTAWKNDGSGIIVSGGLSFGHGPDRAREKGSFDTTLQARNIVVSYGTTGSSWGVEGNRHKFGLTLKANLQEVAERMSALPTLSLIRMEFSGDQWRVEGELYDK